MALILEISRASLVLLVGGGLLFVLTYELRVWQDEGWRMAGLQASAVMGTCVWLIAEGLSLFRAITLAGILAAWAIVALAALLLLVRRLRVSSVPRRTPIVMELRAAITATGYEGLATLAFVAVSAVILGVVAMAAAPNTWDGLTYHLSRVMHWQQDRSLAFYATAIQRQLVFGPFAEMQMLMLQILSGSDRLANFVQYAAMIGCLAGVSMIAQQLGGDRRAQLAAVLLTATLPMGILQATSTQNDYVLAFWCVCFVVFVLHELQAGPSVLGSAMTGLALGLAVLTKAAALVFLPAMGLWLAVGLFRRRGWGAVKTLLAVLCLGLVVNAPQAWRNLRLSGDPLGAGALTVESPISNDRVGPVVLASNILRNLGSELASPSAALNSYLDGAILYAHRLMHLDVSSPSTTWPISAGTQYGVLFTMHEDSASNPLMVMLIFAAALMLIGYRETRAALYLLCVATGFVLFCLVLKWQPWNNRLLLPIFVLAMPLVAVVITRRLRRPWYWLLALVLAATAIPYLVLNPSRPLVGPASVLSVGRLHQYFTNVPDSYEAYDAMARQIAAVQCKRIGLVTRTDGREYLAWVMIRMYTPDAEIQHVLVKNDSRELTTNFTPCAIIVYNTVPTARLSYLGLTYEKVLTQGGLDLFLTGGSN